MSTLDECVMGRAGDTAKAPGHWVLARLGKKVLRPGGVELTRRMLGALAPCATDDVVEFAPGLGATARVTLRSNPRSYVAVERDELAAGAVRRLLTSPHQKCVIGRAEETGLPDARASVVYGEAMLTMQSMNAKDRIVREAARLLAPGGRYGIHEVAVVPDTISSSVVDEISRELSDAIHHSVQPLTLGSWKTLLKANGFHVEHEFVLPMHLLEPGRLLADEGLAGAVRFAWNLARDRQSRRRVFTMRQVFRKYSDSLSAIALVATLV